MADTFDRFTEGARSALERAAEAALHRHGFIGTEHLLVGVMVAGEGPAAEALAELGLGAHGAREQLVRIVGVGTPGEGETGTAARPALTPRAREAIVRAVDEANRRAHEYVGPEHLLLGLMRDEDAVSVAMCQRQGVSRHDVLRAVERRISRN